MDSVMMDLNRFQGYWVNIRVWSERVCTLVKESGVLYIFI